MDKLLGAFTKKYIDHLDNKDLLDLENLLEIEDDELYNFYNGLRTNVKFKENNINKLFKNFEFNNPKTRKVNEVIADHILISPP